MDIRKIILLAMVGMFGAMIAGDADAQRFKGKKGKFRPPPLPPGISLTETNKIADGVYSFRFSRTPHDIHHHRRRRHHDRSNQPAGGANVDESGAQRH